MLIPNHPHDERLSALASGDPEVLADSVLSEHVASCDRCTETVAELGALRASLAELPDLRPHRPLQLLPPAADADPGRVDRVGGWARRFFAPVLTAGAALAMVGLVGTTAPLLDGMASQAESAPMEVGGAADEPQSTDQRSMFGEDPAGVTAEGAGDGDAEVGEPLATDVEATTRDDSVLDDGALALTEERSIWPVVLFAGVALMIAAALLRWILAPRAG
jgi:anti-sigma factor RsiW